MIESAEAILGFTDGLNFEDFQADRKTVDAVVRNLQVIGEAARYMPSEVRSKNSDLPWIEMSAMRNILTHEYFGVDLSIIWQTIRTDLPTLLPRLRSMLSGN
ncbi:MAG TPA: DUF86 domain-containing protein [Acidobacteriota bacterium]|nr:DUF86 domain-containing protein [Acidobacteriota bacterium]